MKTVRFTQVVERCGRPHVHTLWLAPEKDPELSRARKTDRVMTLLPSESGSTEVGHVGFEPQPSHDTQFLIFPKSLKRFADARVIGVKFDLVDEPKLVPATPTLSARVSGKSSPPRRRDSTVELPAGRRHAASPQGARATEKRQEPPSEPRRSSERERPQGKPKAAPRAEQSGSTETPWVREVRAALHELEEGKAVAAHRRLERALEELTPPSQA